MASCRWRRWRCCRTTRPEQRQQQGIVWQRRSAANAAAGGYRHSAGRAGGVRRPRRIPELDPGVNFLFRNFDFWCFQLLRLNFVDFFRGVSASVAVRKGSMT